jgi:hypothetical protein
MKHQMNFKQGQTNIKGTSLLSIITCNCAHGNTTQLTT